jgi:drug/metabolite transporter (DMT)-like permease
MSLAVNLIGSALPSLQTTTFRFIFQGGLTVLTILATRRGRLNDLRTWFGRPGHRSKLIMRGLWGIVGLSCFFYSMQHLAISDATAIV